MVRHVKGSDDKNKVRIIWHKRNRWKEKIGTIDYILHDTPKIWPCKKLGWNCLQHLFATLSIQGECQRPLAYHAPLLDNLL
jgi:hypothetical protein